MSSISSSSSPQSSEQKLETAQAERTRLCNKKSQTVILIVITAACCIVAFTCSLIEISAKTCTEKDSNLRGRLNSVAIAANGFGTICAIFAGVFFFELERGVKCGSNCC